MIKRFSGYSVIVVSGDYGAVVNNRRAPAQRGISSQRQVTTALEPDAEPAACAAGRQVITEIEGGVPPVFSLAFAAFQVIRPEGYTLSHWRKAIDDAGCFLDSHGHQAAALGWTAGDIFATDGLAWGLQGATVTSPRRMPFRTAAAFIAQETCHDRTTIRRTTGYKPEHTDLAFRLARLGATEELMARFFKVPVYAIYEWIETIPKFAAAIEQCWVQATMQPPQRPSRYKYPAYTWALQFAARKKLLELAAALRAKMAEMKALGPEAMAKFNDDLWVDAMSIQPGHKIPRRV
jgi:hypothetical protein